MFQGTKSRLFRKPYSKFQVKRFFLLAGRSFYLPMDSEPNCLEGSEEIWRRVVVTLGEIVLHFNLDRHLVCSYDCYNMKYEKSQEKYRILLRHLCEVVCQHGLHNIHSCKAHAVHHHQWTIVAGIWIRCPSLAQSSCRRGKQILPS